MIPLPKPTGAYKFLTNFPLKEIGLYNKVAHTTNVQLGKLAISISMLPQSKQIGTETGSAWANCTHDELQIFHKTFELFSIFI